MPAEYHAVLEFSVLPRRSLQFIVPYLVVLFVKWLHDHIETVRAGLVGIAEAQFACQWRTQCLECDWGQ